MEGSEFDNLRFETIKKISRSRFKFNSLKRVSKLDSTSPPSVFVGSKLKYPHVNVGILSPLERDENSWIYDSEKYWAENNFSINEVVRLRDSLLNSRFRTRTESARSFGENNRFITLAQEIALASKPVDVELELKRNLEFKRKEDKITTPHGIKAPLKKVRITGNVSIHQKIERVVNDDIKASEGINYLYKNKFNEYTLNKILSIGVLGLKKNKKFVPTRWSITATDDLIGKSLLEKIRGYPALNDYELFFGEFMGNQYIIMFFPRVFFYELFELYLPRSSWNPSESVKASTDYEGYWGRTSYASSTAGGYYATRLPILEYLNSIKRQAGVLVIRLETPSYWASLGVWVVRESVRKALNKQKMIFSSKDELIESAKQISKIKFNFDNSFIFKRSKLLSDVENQKTLREWF